MPIWYDNFDRADGQLGADWSLKTGTLEVVSNAAKTQFNGLALAGPVSGPGNAMAECVVTTPVGSSGAACPVVKCDATANHYYFGWAQNQTTKMEFRIYSYYDGNYPFIGSYVLNGTPATQGVLRLEYAAGVLRLYWNGAQMCQASNSNNAAYGGIGIRVDQTSVEVSQFSASGDGQPQLIVSPKVVGTADGDQLLSLLGVAVTWTPGTPGAPGFSVNGGALNSQSVTSTTNASALFSPPLLPGLVTLSDPVNGLSATITVVAGNYLGTGQGGVGGLSSLAVGWLEAQAAHGGLVLADVDSTGGSVAGVELKGAFGEMLLGVRTPASPATGYVATAGIVDTLWSILNGHIEHTSSADVFQSVLDLLTNLAAVKTQLEDIQGAPLWSLDDVLHNLAGEPMLNHQDLLTAIQSVGGGDLSPVLDELAAMRGDTTTSLYTLLQSLAGIRSTHAYSLEDVKGWIDALPHDQSVPTVVAVVALVAALALAMPTGGASVAAAAVAVGAGPLLDIATIVEVVGVLSELASIAASIADLKNSLTAPVAVASGWPGADGVDFGEPVALSDGAVVEGPLDGLEVTITGHPSGAGKYGFGAHNSWRYVGACVFCSTEGHAEWNQPIGLDLQLLTPQTMSRAGSAILRMNSPAWTGTARGWTVKPPA